MGSSYLDYIILFACLILSGFFSGSETALFSLKNSDLHRFHHSTSRRERYVAGVMHEPQNILITILIGNLFVNLVASALATKMMLSISRVYGHFLSIIILTPVIILLCEIVPKLVSINNNVSVSRKIVPFVNLFHILFLPLRKLLVIMIERLSALFNIGIGDVASITKEEIDTAIRLGEIEGVLNKDEGDFIKNVLRFTKKDALNVMIPRTKAVFLPYGATVKEAIMAFKETSVPRLPVYKGDIDNVVGVLDCREILPLALMNKNSVPIKRFIKDITHYPGSRKLDELLSDFLRKKIQIAVVMDEYGGTAGVVTLGTILSEIIGKDYIWEDVYRPVVRRTQDNRAIISGDMQIDDYNESFNDEIESLESETVGGYIIEKLERIPRKSDEVETRMHVLKVRSVIRNRIHSVEVIKR